MLYQRMNIIALFLVTAALLSPVANANVLVTPALEIGDLGAGDFILGDATTLTINGTGTGIITNFSPFTVTDITDVDFVLTATRGSNNGVDYLFTNGTITAGAYINTTFNTLTMSEIFGFADFSADLANGGRIEGGFMLTGDIASNFGGDTLIAKASPVVPVPAAVWLFGSGLLGLVGVARRKKAAA